MERRDSSSAVRAAAGTGTPMPGSEFALVPGAGHSVYYERPALFNRLVIEFLKRHTSAARG